MIVIREDKSRLYGNLHRLSVQQEEQADVRIPANTLKCVGYVSEVAFSDSMGDDLDHIATGFFVSLKSGAVPGMMFLYFVTARHVVDSFGGKDIRMLVNKKAGGTMEIKPIGDIFYGHPSDSSVDLAVLPLLGFPEMDVVRISSEDFITTEKLKDGFVCVGDEVFMVGLFTFVPGQERITPIARFGNLAMLPLDRVQTHYGFADAYLIEARSIGGLSGSPVFARRTVLLSKTMTAPGGEIVNEPVFGVGGVDLLGVVQGHWDIKESELNKGGVVQHSPRGVNIGIAVVTPAFKLLETINRRELVELRKSIERDYLHATTPKPDSAPK